MANRQARRRAERSGVKLTGPVREHVCFANVNPGEVTCELFGSFINLLTTDMRTTQHIDGFICKRSGGLLSVFRNGVIAEYLGDTDSDWVWLVDSDIALAVDTLNLLMDQRAEHPEAKIITGWYVIPMGEDGFRPCIYDWTGGDWHQEGNFVYKPVPDEVCYVDSVGIGCCLIRRDLLVQMMKKFGRPSPWFTLCERNESEANVTDPRIFGEDHSFFLRAKEFGARPLLVPAAEVGHMKSLMLTKEHLSVLTEE